MHHGTVCGGGIREGTMLLAWLSPCFQSLPSLSTNRLGPFRFWFLGGWACVYSRILWAPWMDSPVKMTVSPTITTPIGFYSQRFWGFSFWPWNPGLCGLSHSPVVPPGLSAQVCGISRSPGTALLRVLSARCPTSPLLPVCMNVSLTLWLLDFHTVQFSDSSGCSLFLNWLFILLLVVRGSEVYLHLHLGQKPNLFSLKKCPLFFIFIGQLLHHKL